MDYEFKIGPIGEAEGVGLIKEMAADQSKAIAHINQTLADAQKEIMLEKLKKEPAVATPKDSDNWLAQTDPKDLLNPGEQESGESSDSGDEPSDEGFGEDTGSEEGSDETSEPAEESGDAGDIN